MKKLFSILAVLLVATSGVGGDDVEQTTPLFPEAVEARVMPGSTFDIAIAPNFDWEVAVPQSVAAYFSIKDGESTLYKKRGLKGEYTITIAVADIELFDIEPVCEVTMTMKGQTQRIATLTMTSKQRELKVYPIVIDEGLFGYATDGDLTYAYLDTEVTADGMTMIWPAEMSLYSTRVKVESNFNWVIDGAPEWIEPIEGGSAGVTELWIKGDETKYPMSSQSATLNFVDATATDKVVGTLKVSIPAATDIFSVEGLSVNTIFNYKGDLYSSMIGEYIEGSALGTVLGIDGSSVVAVEFTEVAGLAQATLNPEWLGVDYAAWDTTSGAVIQPRTLSISVPINEGFIRRATVLVLPNGVAADDVDTITLNGEIADEYKQYIVTVVEQAGNPGSIEIVGEATMESKGNSIEQLESNHWVFGLFDGADVGYEIFYTSEWAYENWYINCVRPYTAIRCYTFDAEGNLVEMTDSETAWIYPELSGENNEHIRIVMDKSRPTAEAAKNEASGEYEGVVAFEDESGVFALMVCRYNDEIPYEFKGLNFYYPQYAAEQNSTLVELTSGVLYNAYSKYGERVYQLTYTTATPNLSMLTGLPQQWAYVNEADQTWLSYEYSEDYQMVTMNPETGNNRNGALVFADGAVVLICTLKIAK